MRRLISGPGDPWTPQVAQAHDARLEPPEDGPVCEMDEGCVTGCSEKCPCVPCHGEMDLREQASIDRADRARADR